MNKRARQFLESIIAYKAQERVNMTLAEMMVCDDEGLNLCDQCGYEGCPHLNGKLCPIWKALNLAK